MIYKYNTRFILNSTQVKYGDESGKLICILVDRHLPTIPALKINITSDYPDQSPKIVGMAKDYGLSL